MCVTVTVVYMARLVDLLLMERFNQEEITREKLIRYTNVRQFIGSPTFFECFISFQRVQLDELCTEYRTHCRKDTVYDVMICMFVYDEIIIKQICRWLMLSIEPNKLPDKNKYREKFCFFGLKKSLSLTFRQSIKCFLTLRNKKNCQRQ